MLPDVTTPAAVFIAFFDAQRRDDYLALSARLRDAGVACEMFPDAKKLGAQLKYADAHGFSRGPLSPVQTNGIPTRYRSKRWQRKNRNKCPIHTMLPVI